MEAFPSIAIVTADAVLASAIPAQIHHRYGASPTVTGDWPQFRQLLASAPPAVAIIDLHHSADALPELVELRAEYPHMALIGIAKAGGQADNGAFATISPFMALLSRPLSIPALMRRLDQVRYRHTIASNQQKLAFNDGISFHLAEKAIYSADGQCIELTDKESALLAFLYRNCADWLTRERLLEAVWGYGEGVDTHTLETHLYRLRGKLRPLWSEKDLVLTHQGNYRLNPDLL